MARLSRWTLIAAAALMGVALVTTVWSTRKSVDGASQTLIRGHADVLRDSIRVRLASLAATGDGELAVILDDYRAEGLRYLAVLDSDGEVVASAGDRLASRAELSAALRRRMPLEPVAIHDRVLVTVYRPRRHHRLRRSRVVRRRPIPFAFELEPEIAAQLQRAANRTTAIGAIAAGGFLIVALGLVRWFLHRAALERALERDRRLASLGQMSAVLAHELRNPLASLKGNAQLLARSLPDGDKPRAKADRVVDEAIRLETLTNDLLAFARGGEIFRVDTDPVALVREAAASIIGGDAIQIDATAAPRSWSLDPDRMRQVLTNLLENALEAAGDGEVVARIARQGTTLVYGVHDRGPGLGDADPDRLFEPFYTRRTSGTGLGLAVAKRLVELHGGTISAADAAGGGALFEVRLPRR